MALHDRPDPKSNPFRLLLEQNGHTSAHPGPDGLIIIDWSEERDMADELVDGFAIAGRWTAIAAAAKAGKSSLLVSVSVEVSEGRHPFDATLCDPVRVLYVDAEMGRLDLEQRLIECGYKPALLSHWWACDIPPRLDTLEGAAKVLDYVRAQAIQFVVIDGINGTVGGNEKDDAPWRLLFEYTIQPLKVMGVAVMTADNLGKDSTLGPRGSSVKLDKADAVLNLTRTAKGVGLHASHRRTAAYPVDTYLDLFGIEGDEPIRYRRAISAAYPDGTKDVADLLDELGVDPTLGRDKVRKVLRQAAEQAPDKTRFQVRNETLSAAIRWRKEAGMRLGTGKMDDLGTPTTGRVEQVAAEQVGQAQGTVGTGLLTSVGDGGGVVDTPVPNVAPEPYVDPNTVLF